MLGPPDRKWGRIARCQIYQLAQKFLPLSRALTWAYLRRDLFPAFDGLPRSPPGNSTLQFKTSNNKSIDISTTILICTFYMGYLAYYWFKNLHQSVSATYTIFHHCPFHSKHGEMNRWPRLKFAICDIHLYHFLFSISSTRNKLEKERKIFKYFFLRYKKIVWCRWNFKKWNQFSF